jgi:hypothetical protein
LAPAVGPASILQNELTPALDAPSQGAQKPGGSKFGVFHSINFESRRRLYRDLPDWSRQRIPILYIVSLLLNFRHNCSTYLNLSSYFFILSENTIRDKATNTMPPGRLAQRGGGKGNPNRRTALVTF